MTLKINNYEYNITSFTYRITAFDDDNNTKKFQKILSCNIIDPIDIDEIGEDIVNNFDGNIIINSENESYQFYNFNFDTISLAVDENKNYDIIFIKSMNS